MILVVEPPFAWLGRWLPRARPLPAAPTHRLRMRLCHGTSEVVARPDRGFTVRCTSGRLWVTHDGDPRDLVLDAGDTYRPEHAGRMTLHAVRESELEIAFRPA